MGCLMLRARRANLCTYRETGLPAPARKGVFARCPSTKRWHAFRSLIYIKRSKGEVSAGRCEGASLLVNRPVPRSGKQGVRPRRVSAFDSLGRARGRRSTCRTCASRSSVLSNVVAQLIPQEVSALQLASKYGWNRVLRAGSATNHTDWGTAYSAGSAEPLQQRRPNRQRQHSKLRRSIHEFRFALARHVSCSCRDAPLLR